MPLYRTKEDARQERVIHKAIRPHIRGYFNLEDRPPLVATFEGDSTRLPYDCLIRDAKAPTRLFAALEFKRRYVITRRSAADYRIGRGKMLRLAEFCWRHQIPGAVAVQLDEDLGLVPLNVVVACDVAQWGREDRHAREIEPSFCVPWREFFWLGPKGQEPRGPVSSSAYNATQKKQRIEQREQVAPHYGDPFASLT